MKYMIMMFGDQAGMMESRSVEWIREMIQFMHKFNDDLTHDGALVSAQGLVDATQAKTVDFKNVGGDGYETIQVQEDRGNNQVVVREETRPITYYYELFCFIDGHQVANGWLQIN